MNFLSRGILNQHSPSDYDGGCALLIRQTLVQCGELLPSVASFFRRYRERSLFPSEKVRGNRLRANRFHTLK